MDVLKSRCYIHLQRGLHKRSEGVFAIGPHLHFFDLKERMAMNAPGKLSLEQQFKLQVLREQVKNLTQEQAQEYLVEVMRQMMVKDNLVKHFLKNA